MRRTLTTRCLAALCALWLAISVAAPELVHACPMHGAMHGGAGVGTGHAGHGVGSGPTGHQHGGHLHHGGATAATEHVADGGHAPAAAAVCVCPGSCTAPAGLSLLPEPPALALRDRPAPAAPGLPEHEYRPLARALLLPFAIGPPARAPSFRAA